MRGAPFLGTFCCVLAALAAACGNDGAAGNGGSPDAGAGDGGNTGAGGGSGGSSDSGGANGSGGSTGNGGANGSGGSTSNGGANGSGGSSGNGGANGSGGSSDGGGGGGPIPPITDTCTPSISLEDTSNPSAVVGTGTPESCTEAALRTAAEAGGVVTFDCGAGPVTIDVSQTIELNIDRDTTIDGGGLITLDAGKRTRHFLFEDPGWLDGTTRVTLQRLVLRNGAAPLGEYFPPLADPACAYGYKGESSGGVIYMRNGNLRIIDSDLIDNQAALVGPDVGGGAVYVFGSPSFIVSGSRFLNNRASNGGAIGMLFTNPEIYNSVFENNTAEGIGMNTAGHDQCPDFGHPGQGGAGGLAGAVFFDGANDVGHVYTICGSTFTNNRSNELAGALFRTPNVGMREMLIDRCIFDSNTADAGGVSFIMQQELTVRASFFTNNRAGVNVMGEETGPGPFGALWVNDGNLVLENSTFHQNDPSHLNIDGTVSVTSSTFSGGRFDSGEYTFESSLFVDVACNGTDPGSNNVQWPNGTACAGDTTFADPNLGAPADNGGPTPTQMPGNPSAVAGVGANCLATDQRGEPRNTASCAAGAVEP